jgi:CDP-glucose 4,6-dehydratase
LRAIEGQQKVYIRNPNAVRPWQHVLEPLSGYLTLAEKLYCEGSAFAEAFNFGPAQEDAKPVQWLVKQFTQSWGDSASWQLDDGKHPHESHYLKLDCSKAHSRLGWRPRWNLSETIDAIIIWHKAYMTHDHRQDTRALCLQQISDYSISN